MRIEDLYQLRLFSSPQISPDGKRVLFQLNTVDRARDDYRDNLCTIPTRGGKVTRLPTKDAINQSPSWSPDGKKVLFVSGESGQGVTKLSVLDLGKGRTSTLCEMPKSVEKPQWSPDGRKILFLSRVKVDKEQIAHKSDVKIVKHLWYKFTTTGWFHDTRKHVFVVDSRGGKPKQLTTGEFDVASAAWMPDGKKVAFVANMTPATDTSIYKDVWVTPASSSSQKGAKRVTNGRWQIDAVSVMPRDSTILFVGRGDPRRVFHRPKKIEHLGHPTRRGRTGQPYQGLRPMGGALSLLHPRLVREPEVRGQFL